MATSVANLDFRALAAQDNKVLDQLFQAGKPVTTADVVGYEYRGWNMVPGMALVGNKKFKKGFYRNPDTSVVWGYNIRAKMGSIDEPWLPLPSEENPKRLYFFSVADPAPGELYPNALVLDYRRWPGLVVDPVRYTLDYLVVPNPANKNLLLARTYNVMVGRIFLGYFILERLNKTDYHGPTVSPILSKDQGKALRAVLECQMAVLRPSAYNDDPDQVMADVEAFLRDASADARDLVLLLLDLILVEAILRPPKFRPFWEWDVSQRQQWLANLPNTSPLRGKQLRDVIGVLFSLGWLIIYSRPAGRALFGASSAEPIDPKTHKPAVPKPVPEPAYAPDFPASKYKVCVIGSGAGGAVVAARLAEANIGPLLVVEAGKWVSPEDYPRLRDDQTLRRCYMQAGIQPALSNPIPIEDFLKHGRVSTINVLQGSLVGGGPAVNNAICFRMPPPGQRRSRWTEWQAAGIPFDYTQLDAVYQIIYRELGLQDANVDQAAGWRSALFTTPNNHAYKRLDIAVHECLGCGGCNTGCRYGRKTGGLGNLNSYLERARAAGALVGSDLRAERFEIVDGRARRLVLRDMKRDLPITVEADAFVLAAGPIASTAILARTGLIHLPVGRRASANVVTPVYGVFASHNDRDFEPGLQMCYFTDEEDGTLLRESWFHYPGSVAVSLPAYLQDSMERMRDYAKLSCLGVVVPTGPNGHVGYDGRLFLSLNQDEFRLMQKGIAAAARDLFDANAERVHLASKAPISFDKTQIGDLEALIERALTDPGDLNLATAHPQGGNAISTNPGIAVVDARFEVCGVKGIFVADASLFPAGCGVNPMMTTMALAHMAAEKIRAALA